MRQAVNVPQVVIDEHAMVAQTYAGFLVGHPVRAARYTTPLPGSVDIDFTRAFVEPNPMQDDCIFCQRLTDADAERRVFGFQAAIDKEVLARKWKYLSEWVTFSPAEDIPTFIEHDAVIDLEQPDGSVKQVRQRNISAMTMDFANRRKFVEQNQYVPRPARPNGWATKAAPIVSLPLRIKRKMCVDFNHVYTRWMATDPSIQYDFEKREFYKEVESVADFETFLGIG